MTVMDEADVLPFSPPHDDIQIVLPTRRFRSAEGLKSIVARRLRNLPLFLAIGLLLAALTAGFAAWLSGGWFEPRQQRQFNKYESTLPLIEDGTISDRWPDGVPISLLRIPRFNRSLAVGTDAARTDLRDGPGLSPGSAFPNSDGNSVIVGKSSTYGSPFADLKRLVPGDQILVTNPLGTFVYQVSSLTKAKPSDAVIYEESATPQLTLLTNRGGAFSRDLYVVKADRVLGTASTSIRVPPLPKTEESGFAPIIVLGIIAAIVGLIYLANSTLSKMLSRIAALWLVVPLIAALSIPLVMQFLLLLPRGY